MSLLEVNDYELLYYIYEGNEAALKILISKYEVVTLGIIKRNFDIWRSDKKYDLLQEGRIMVFRCLKLYHPSPDITFYVYFCKSLRNKFYKLYQNPYYYERILSENIEMFIPDLSSEKNKYDYLFSDYIEVLVYENIIKDGFSFNSVAEKYNISYYKLKQTYDSVVIKLREALMI